MKIGMADISVMLIGFVITAIGSYAAYRQKKQTGVKNAPSKN